MDEMNKLKIINSIVQDYTIVLSSRDMRHLGQLTGLQNINLNRNLNSADEISFSVSKYKMIDVNGNNSILSDETYIKIKTALWKQIVDLKLIWIKELNEYFEIKVKTDDSKDIIKNITATSLCEAELSQLLLDNIEINTEDDIARDDYEITTFYNEENHNASLLHRILEKAPHYTIKYVDESLKNLQRSFSISDEYIYDFLVGDCSDQFNCLFEFDSSDRSISVYDLYTTCKDCNYRGDYYDVCPECGSTNLKYFGEDTTILVDKNNLTDSISLEANVDSIKNCFKLVAGDDLMTATIRTLNQNGSDYIYYISEAQRQDMPKGLVERLDSYDELYNSYTEEYQELVNTIYELTDEILYLESGKMPTIENAEVTAETEVEKLTSDNLSPLGLSNVTTATSLATVNSALKNYAKVYAKSGYVKLEINDGATFEYTGINEDDGWSYGTWTGSITVTNYSDEEDVATTEPLTITVYDNYQDFVKQKILKSMAEDDEEGSVFDVLAIEDIDKFKEALSLYCKNRLTSFYDAIQGALDVLVQLDQASEGADLYESLYLPYYEKLQACQEALDSIQAEIDSVQKELDEAETRRSEIQAELDFKKYLGEYFTIFCAYRREQKYSNENYISDGLSNSELIENANEFIETAKKELYKSGERQWTLSSTLFNLLAIPEFKPLDEHFKLGNWIRLKVDGELFRLRLLGYSLDFDSIESMNVEFSNVSKIKDVVYEAQQIIQSAKTISSSYGYVSKQAEKGNDAQNNIEVWKQTGLDSGLIQIKNNNNEEITYGKHGLLCRAFDDITGEYEDEQLKIVHNSIAFTDNNWKSVRQAIGKHSYTIYNDTINEWENKIGYGMTADFVTAGHVNGSSIVGGKIYSSNFSREIGNEAGTYIDLDEGSFSFAGGGLTYDHDNGLVLESSAIEDAIEEIGVVAENLVIKSQNISGLVTSDQIKSLEAGKITGIITSDQIEQGAIKAGSVDAADINGMITSDQIESLASNKLTEDITSDQIKSLESSKITGTVTSSQIESTLSNKTLSNCSFTGTLKSSIKTSDGSTEYSGVTGEYIIGENTLKIVNGLIVSVT